VCRPSFFRGRAHDFDIRLGYEPADQRGLCLRRTDQRVRRCHLHRRRAQHPCLRQYALSNRASRSRWLGRHPALAADLASTPSRSCSTRASLKFPGSRCRKVAIQYEQIRLRIRASTTSSCDRLATMGSEPPRRFDRKSGIPAGKQLEHVGLAGARVISAHDVVARHK